MQILSYYSDKGGVGKTTSLPSLAASLVSLNPGIRVGLMDLCPDHGHLSKRYAMDREAMVDNEFHGVFAVIEALSDPRKNRPEIVTRAIQKATSLLQVLPGADKNRCTLSFINISVELSKHLRSLSQLNSQEGAKHLGERLFDAIEKELMLDYLFVDLPGAVEDGMVRMTLPHCSCVVIPIDMRDSIQGLAEADTLVAKLRERAVEPTGFIRTFMEYGDKIPAAQKDTQNQLQMLSEVTGVPILPGGVPNRTSIPQSLGPFESEIDGVEFATGLYIAASIKGVNEAQGKTYKRAIDALEYTIKQMLAPVAEPV